MVVTPFDLGEIPGIMLDDFSPGLNSANPPGRNTALDFQYHIRRNIYRTGRVGVCRDQLSQKKCNQHDKEFDPRKSTGDSYSIPGSYYQTNGPPFLRVLQWSYYRVGSSVTNYWSPRRERSACTSATE